MILLILTAVYGDASFFYHYYDGQLKVNNDTQAIVEGLHLVQFQQNLNVSLIVGMHIKENTFTPFSFMSVIRSLKQEGVKVIIEAYCFEVNWGLKTSNKVSGKINIQGAWDKLSYDGKIYSEDMKIMFEMKATGMNSPCPFFSPSVAVKRAHNIIGEKSEKFQRHQVLNYAILGYPYFSSARDCKFWLDNTKTSGIKKPGFAIVGLDGKHCGIIDKEGDKFIHTHPSKREVTLTPLTMANDFFPKGYVYKDFSC